MPVFLHQRQPQLTEYMDRPDCDPVLLENTYRQFRTINLLLSQWKQVYKTYLRPKMEPGKTYTLLDIGFGGGDIPLKLAEWSSKDGYDLKITAVDTDPRTLEFARQAGKKADSVTFKNVSSTELAHQGASFDFVISNHMLHHLTDQEVRSLLSECKLMASQLVLFNDIERSDIGYVLFNLFSRLLFRKSFITADGLISIKRSYTYQELMKLVPEKWRVRRKFPFRLLLIYDRKH